MDLRTRRFATAALLPLFAAGALGACSEDDETGTEPLDAETTTEEETAAVGEEADVFTAPEDFVGESVTAEGEVSDQINERVFRFGPAGDDILVVSAVEGTQLSATDETELAPDTVVTVTGTVHEVAEDTFEDDFGMPWEDDLAEFEGEYAIGAESIEIEARPQGGTSTTSADGAMGDSTEEMTEMTEEP